MSQRMSASQMLKPIAVGLLVTLAGVGYLGCKKDEPPPPLPTPATASVAPTQTAPLELIPEDAGIADAAEDADAAKKGGGGGSSMKACCAALAQNAKSAPPPNNQYMEAAALACNAAVGAGQSQAAISAAIQAALRGAGMPPGCK